MTIVNTPFNAAALAYSNAQRLIDQAAKPGVDPVPLAKVNGASFAHVLAEQVKSVAEAGIAGDRHGNSFTHVLAEQVQGVVEAGAASDQMALDMMNGKANVVDMVTALSETEMAIDTMVTIRDRVISAYEEIMRMPI